MELFFPPLPWSDIVGANVRKSPFPNQFQSLRETFPVVPKRFLFLTFHRVRMALLQQIQVQLQDPTIPWQPLVIGLGIGVTVFEGWIGLVTTL